jgi:cell division inhibitor SepF
MSLGDLWSRTLVYFGIAEEDDDYYDEDDEGFSQAEETLEQSYRDRPNVRRLTPRRRASGYDDWTESSEAEGSRGASAAQSRAAARSGRPRIVEAVPDPNSVRVHLVLPRSFNDAQQIADRFKQSIPVILNLQNADSELSKRLIDFASGLTYALNGGMQRVADKVFLLTPRNVEVSAEQRAQLLERGGFFNQA